MIAHAGGLLGVLVLALETTMASSGQGISGGSPSAHGYAATNTRPPPGRKPNPRERLSEAGTPASADPTMPEAASESGTELPPGHPTITGTEPSTSRPERSAAPVPTVDPRFFQPPVNAVLDDPSLPTGVVMVRVLDAQGLDVRGTQVSLDIVHNSVAKGEAHDTSAHDTDAAGSVRFGDLVVSSGTSYHVRVARGEAMFSVPPFSLNERAGKRVVLHAYDSSPDVNVLPIALESVAYLSLREGAIQVDQMLTVYDVGPVAWTPNVTFALPRGFRAFEAEAAGSAAVDEVPGVGGVLRGTFGPGRHEVTFRYNVPLTNDARQTFTISLPPRVAHARVVAEVSRTMGLDVVDFPAAQPAEGREGSACSYASVRSATLVHRLARCRSRFPGCPVSGSNDGWRWPSLAACLLGESSTACGMLIHKDSPDGRDRIFWRRVRRFLRSLSTSNGRDGAMM